MKKAIGKFLLQDVEGNIACLEADGNCVVLTANDFILESQKDIDEFVISINEMFLSLKNIDT